MRGVFFFRIMIKTHYNPTCEPPWLAIDMTKAAEKLKGYNLTDAEKTDVAELMFGYCRLIEEAGLDHYGETEHEAIMRAKA